MNIFSNESMFQTLACRKSHHVTPDSPSESPKVEQHPPCKLISILKDNPRADLTQVDCLGEKLPCGKLVIPDGISCKEALNTVLPYATNDEKLDSIAIALEAGCTRVVRNGDNEETCAVRYDVLWKLLDEVCIE